MYRNKSRRRVFPQLFRILPNFHECFDKNTENVFSISFRKHRDVKEGNNLLTLIIKAYLIMITMIHLLGLVHPNTEACMQGRSVKLRG